MFWFLYNLVFTPVYVLLLPRFFVRMWRRGGYRDSFGQRFGNYEPSLRKRLPRDRVWVHAVSVGEVQVALRFIEAWREAEPDALFVLSLTTSTGRRVAGERLDRRDEIIYFPVDTPWVVNRVLQAVRPRAYVMVEQEFWPNLLRRLNRDGVPVAIINGRISDRSFPRYRLARFFTKRVLPLIDLFCMQSSQDAGRIIVLGAPRERVRTLPSLKYEPALVDPGVRAEVRAMLTRLDMGAERTLWVGGSVWPEEFGLLARVFKRLRERHPGLRLVLVPRHFERAGIAEAEVRAEGLRPVRKRELGPGAAPGADVLIADTTGEMMAFYDLADIVFVGKSLEPRTPGGQNPIEPAALGKAVLVGPHMRNFAGVMEDMLGAGAIVQVEDEAGLEHAVDSLLADPRQRSVLGATARELVEANRRSVPDTVAQVLAVVRSAGGRPAGAARAVESSVG